MITNVPLQNQFSHFQGQTVEITDDRLDAWVMGKKFAETLANDLGSNEWYVVPDCDKPDQFTVTSADGKHWVA